MNNYGPLFAQHYNRNAWQYAQQIGPPIREYYEALHASPEKSVLDIGCGTGQLALYFLELGYRVLGIDLSPDMLHYAYQNSVEYVQKGLAQFVQADAANYTPEQKFGLAISTNDAINHFPDKESLQSCFAMVAGALIDDGIFIFDVNTRYGLTQRWNNAIIIDTDEKLIVNRKIYDGGTRARARVTGFLRSAEGTYERFEEHFFNTVFELNWIETSLINHGFSQVHFTTIKDLSENVGIPEQLMRAVVVAWK